VSTIRPDPPVAHWCHLLQAKNDLIRRSDKSAMVPRLDVGGSAALRYFGTESLIYEIKLERNSRSGPNALHNITIQAPEGDKGKLF
jgi:hypothetical protein